MKSYSQLKAMIAITKASLHSITRNPSAIVFNFIFPLIFIVVFGFIGGSGYKIDLAIDENSDVKNPLFESLLQVKQINLVLDKTQEEINSELEKGRIDGLIKIVKNENENPKYFVELKTTKASPDRGNILKMMLSDVIDKQNIAMNKSDISIAELKAEVVEGRKFKTIDFILPGQLGFSLLSAGVFGTAFVFISLRQTLVIKRFFATPIKKVYIVLGESLSRLIFSMFSSVIIILIGTFFFGFTLVNGFTTFINMIILSIIALVVFLGFGFVVSGIAKNENSVPPVANLVTLPQFLLSGTFFPISNFPKWLQPIAKAMPLTYLNDGLRKISFEGASLFGVWDDVLILFGWGIVIYAIAVKVFRWE